MKKSEEGNIPNFLNFRQQAMDMKKMQKYILFLRFQ